MRHWLSIFSRCGPRNMSESDSLLSHDEEFGNAQTHASSLWGTARRKVKALAAVQHGRPRGVLPRVVGAEPADMRKIGSHLREIAVVRPVKADIFDFGAQILDIREDLTNAEFLEALQTMEPPKPGNCRWMHITGHSFDILEGLAVKYNFHPLAVEDIAHLPQRIKIDAFYESFIYISAVEVGLKSKDASSKRLQRVDSLTGKAELGNAESLRAPLLRSSQSGRFAWLSLKDMLAALHVSQVSLLYHKDGTVITIFEEHGGTCVKAPLEDRIRTPGTMLRDSGDPSFLVYSILDVLVDLLVEVVDGYASDVALVEDRVLRTDEYGADLTKEIHLIIGELVALRRTIAPLKSILSALAAPRTSDGGGDWTPVSDLTRTFLADVQDHVNQALDNLDSLERQCQGLVDLVFNFISVQTNDSMRILAVISIVFLPITFLAGVCGYLGPREAKAEGKKLTFSLEIPLMSPTTQTARILTTSKISTRDPLHGFGRFAASLRQRRFSFFG